jgi:hypothetical protein
MPASWARIATLCRDGCRDRAGQSTLAIRVAVADVRDDDPRASAGCSRFCDSKPRSAATRIRIASTTTSGSPSPRERSTSARSCHLADRCVGRRASPARPQVGARLPGMQEFRGSSPAGLHRRATSRCFVHVRPRSSLPRRGWTSAPHTSGVDVAWSMRRSHPLAGVPPPPTVLR